MISGERRISCTSPHPEGELAITGTPVARMACSRPRYSQDQPVVFHREQVRRAAGAEAEMVVAGQGDAVSRRSLGGARVSLRAETANRSNFRVGS